MSRGSPGFAILGSVALVSLAGAAPWDAADFERDVLPIFQEHCVACHGPEEQESFLRLATRAEALKGGMSGPVIVPGKSLESLLVQHVIGEMSPRMPHEKPPLSADEIATLAAWIDAGASGADGEAALARSPAAHWGFVPPVRHGKTALDRHQIMAACEASLRRLDTDYIDLYQTHWPDHGMPYEEVLGVLTELREAGKVRVIGCSNETCWGLMKSLWQADSSRVDRYQTVQNNFSLISL